MEEQTDNEVNVIELPLGERYVEHWTVFDALRELFQNAIDTNDWDYSLIDKDLTIVSFDCTISTETLLLGNSPKTNNKAAIGKYGEGYKLALLVLARNGIPVEVRTNNQLWTVYIEQSKTFKSSVLKIKITTMPFVDDHTSFTIYNIKKYWEEYKIMNLHLHSEYTKIKTAQCEVLLDEQFRHKIYVGGLYVCEYHGTTLYGYNFKPEVFPLGRDRQAIGGFEAAWETAKALVEAAEQNADLMQTVIENIDRNVEDIRFVDSFTTSHSNLVDSYAEQLIKRLGQDVIPVYSDKEKSHLKKQYKNIKVAYVGERAVSIFKQSDKYRELLDKLEIREPDPTPEEVLHQFLDKYADDMSYKLSVAFTEELIAKSVAWTVKDSE